MNRSCCVSAAVRPAVVCKSSIYARVVIAASVTARHYAVLWLAGSNTVAPALATSRLPMAASVTATVNALTANGSAPPAPPLLP